ncbi:MFS transporter [Hyphomonas sp.]|uniref:MFS transporter n=1 Tax=Hyphomonas sp. TaxID=87 RepID=UPI000E04B5D8|nr:MFS transporter [Hyphomonas sp.]RCL83674.1 MAG: MFS transporter [Hyphomonas sp.]
MNSIASQGLSVSPATRIGFGRRTGFGLGDFGINIFWNMTNLFAMFFYTDVAGLPNFMAGLVIFGAMLWDAVTDPLVGLLADRTRTKLGRFRPYLFIGAIPLGLSFMFMFRTGNLELGALALYAFATQIVFRTFYTIVSVPYGSLSARMTKDPNERSTLAVYRMVFATTAGIMVAAFTRDGAMLLGDGDLKLGFERLAIVYAGLGALAVLGCAAFTREPDIGRGEKSPALRDQVRMMRQNSAFWIVFATTVIGGIGSTVAGKAMLYYLKYNLSAEHLFGVVMFGITLMVMLCVPIWGFLSRRIGKRAVWACGASISAVTTTLLFFNPVETALVVTLILMFGATGSAASYVSVWSTLPDTVEYGEWKTGVRSESLVFGAIAFAQKLSLGVATLFSGILLDTFGYVANQEQTPQALFGLKIMISVIPFMAAVTCLILILNYRLDQSRHREIVRDIECRQSNTDTQ